MRRMDWDPLLAFTAQLALQPGLTDKEGRQWRADLLAAWYAQDQVLHFDMFARQWQAAKAGREAAGWVFDGGQMPETVARHVLTLVTEGDPELANFAAAPVHGDDTAWNAAANEAFWAEIERQARTCLGDPGE